MLIIMYIISARELKIVAILFFPFCIFYEKAKNHFATPHSIKLFSELILYFNLTVFLKSMSPKDLPITNTESLHNCFSFFQTQF